MCIILYLEKSENKFSQSAVILFLFNFSIIIFSLFLDMLEFDLLHHLFVFSGYREWSNSMYQFPLMGLYSVVSLYVLR